MVVNMKALKTIVWKYEVSVCFADQFGHGRSYLHASLRRIALEEREPNKERCNSAEGKLRNNVTRHPPVLLKDTVRALPDLCRYRHGVRATARLLRNIKALILLLLVQLLDLLLHFLRVVTSLPDIIPLFPFVVLAGVDNLEHVLRGVLFFAALAAAVVLEVVEELLGVLADFAKVDGFAALGEEEEAIEFLEEDCAWLVDGAEDGLTG
jgi:hypothetical protein